MEAIVTGATANSSAEAAKGIFQKAKRHIRYVIIYKENVKKFEEKLKTLMAKRTSVQQEVDVAGRNLEELKADVQLWCKTVDEKIEEEKTVKDLEDKAMNKCLFTLCPNIKTRYQLSRKAEEGATAFDELLRQGEFNSVSCPAPPPDIVNATPKDFEAFKSRKKVFDDVMEALNDANINVIGVYGMGGTGKTTLVKEVARQVQEDKLFDKVVMAIVNQTPDILKIQDQLAELLGLNLAEKTAVARAGRLRERLKKEKTVLIILDDIWTKLDLNDVGIPFGDEHKECNILLTSRDLNLLRNEMDAQQYFAIDVLDDDEAWNLFKKMAGDNVESRELKSTATDVAKKCAGLPLAIKTVARALRNKGLFAWKDALRQLPAADVYSAIMLSYNHLESEELKQTFLLCSLLRRSNTSIEDLLRYAIGLGLMAGVNTVEDARNRLLTMVSQLKESCLLLDGYKSFGNIEYFDMHDLVYDVAMSTASKDSPMFEPKDDYDLQNWLDGEEMKCCNKIYLRDPSICKLPDELNCPHLVLFLMFSKHPLLEMPFFSKHPSLEMSTNFFKETTNLKVLNLSMMQISSLPSSIRLLTSLCTLCLDQCKLGELAIIGELKNLEILSLKISDIKSLPKEIGLLFKLKLLDFSWCRELKIIPPGILSGLSRLEELYMDGTFSQWELEGSANQGSNASLAELLTLSRLTTLNVDILDANATPWDLFFEKLQKLEKYKIRIGIGGEMLWFHKYEYSRTLILKPSTSIVHFNHGIKLKKAEDLYFHQLEGVKIALQKLKGEESFWHLKKLCIENGSEIKYIINDNDVADEFPQLRSLRLEDLPQLISFCSEEKSGSTSKPQHELPLFNEKVSFTCLEELQLSSINVERIWHNQPSNESFCTHPNLTSLVIKDCDNLKQLFSSSVARGLVHLKNLEITRCKLLREIIFMEDEDIEEENKAAISFPQLNTLKIDTCPELKGFIFNTATNTKKSFFSDKVSFPCLEKLHLSYINVYRISRNQPSNGSFCTHPKLTSLTIKNCDNLKQLFSSFVARGLEHLKDLEITGCKLLREIIFMEDEDIEEENKAAISFSQLNTLKIKNCPKLKEFIFNSATDTKKSFFSDKVLCPNLKTLKVRSCHNLKYMFQSSLIKHFKQLLELTLHDCENMEEVIFVDGLAEAKSEAEEKGMTTQMSFPKLEKLNLNSLPKLVLALFNEKVSFPCLEELRLSKINVERILHNQPSNGSFCTHPNLTILTITDCDNLKQLFSSSSSVARGLMHLKGFGISRCKLLREIIFTDDEDIEEENRITISFSQLNTLMIKDCSELKGFIFNSATDTKKSFFSDKVSFPCLEKLHLSKINVERISHNQPSNGSFCTHPNLTSLTITDCDNLKQLFSSSVARGLMHLKDFEISGCKLLREIIFTEDEDIEEENRTTISFSQLNTLMIKDCPELKGFIFNSATDTKKFFFSDKVSFPYLEKLHLSKINVERLSHNQPSNGSFCTHPNLTSLTITDCDNLKQLFSSSSSVARGLMHLKDFEINRCKLLREIIFTEDEDIEEENRSTISFSQLNSLMIKDCPELKRFIFNSAMDTKKSFFSDKVSFPCLEKLHLSNINVERIWYNEPSFRFFCTHSNLTSLTIKYCDNLKHLLSFSMAKRLVHLKNFEISGCKLLREIIFTEDEDIEEENKVTISFSQLDILEIKNCPELKGFIFNSATDTKKSLFSDKVAFPCLRMLTIEGMGMWSKIWHHKVAMERLEKLEWLWISDCESLEEIIEFPEHGFNPKLKVFNSKLHNLDSLLVMGCNKVKAKILGGEYLNFGETQPLFWVSDQETFSNPVTSFVSFQNLIDLEVSRCHGFINLVTLRVAKSMVQLKSMTIEDCRMIEEIVASSTSDEVMDGIVFSKLETLELKKLPSLSSFFSGNCTFEFPSFEKLIMNQCPKMKIFTKGELNTPMLQGIKSTKYGGNYVGHYEGNLNATVKQLFVEQDVQNSKEEKEDDDD